MPTSFFPRSISFTHILINNLTMPQIHLSGDDILTHMPFKGFSLVWQIHTPYSSPEGFEFFTIQRSFLACLLGLNHCNLVRAFDGEATMSLGKRELKGMLKIASTSVGMKVWRTSSSCQFPVSKLMSSLTIEIAGIKFDLVSTPNLDESLSHLSDQMLIDAPLPICHLHPFQTIFCATKMLLHA